MRDTERLGLFRTVAGVSEAPYHSRGDAAVAALALLHHAIPMGHLVGFEATPEMSETPGHPGVSHQLLNVREGGFEPPRPFGHCDLNAARLPFRHSRVKRRQGYPSRGPPPKTARSRVFDVATDTIE